MDTEQDRPIDDYLWDPSATSSPEVEAVERQLAPLRFDSSKRPLSLEAAPAVRPIVRLRPLLAIAATLALVAVGTGAILSWRLAWRTGAAWTAEIENASQSTARVETRLTVGEPLQLTSTNSARVNIARIGTMQVAPDSAITLTETTATRHRVVLDRGSVNVRIWAPPGMFGLRTPAGMVRDLGCVFDLTVDTEGTAHLHVDTGWVEMDNDFGESLVPAGAVALMRRLSRPGVPIFEDASDAFARAVRAAQDGGDAAERREMDTIVRTARRHDTLTLLMLANVSASDMKRPLLTRAAELWPPPQGVSVDGIVAGDREQLWKWHSTLDLPPVKNWWRNWRDALPWRR